MVSLLLSLQTSQQLEPITVFYLVSAGVAVIPTVYYVGKLLKGVYNFWAYCHALKDLPGPKPHFFWGNIKQLPQQVRGNNLLENWLVLLKKYEGHPFIRFWFGPQNCVVFLLKPDVVRDILKGYEPKPMQSGGTYRVLLPFLGNGLVLASGAEWVRNRRLLNHAFHLDILKTYMEVNNKATDVLLEKWRKVSHESGVVEVFNDTSLLSFDILLKCAFSSENTVQIQRNPWYYPDFIYFRTKEGKMFLENVNYVNGLAEDVVAMRRKALQDESGTHKRHLDFLDVLLTAKDENGIGLSDTQIIDEVNTFLFAGHHSIATTVSWILYALAAHPECQETLRHEVKKIQAGSPDIKWEDLGRFTYLTMCMKEAMRCYTPVPFIGRILSKDMNFGGIKLPKGTSISVPLYILHHNPAVWDEDHMEFKPSRFSAEKQKMMDPFAFVPFSAGPRNCIGQNFAMNEMKVIMIKIIQSFHITLAPGPKVIPRAEVVLRARNKIKIQLSLIK